MLCTWALALSIAGCGGGERLHDPLCGGDIDLRVQ